ncbi:hypothetical protein [Enterococcus gallinarum]|nr:hypothetical protein [Enterococcus gallinarum]
MPFITHSSKFVKELDENKTHTQNIAKTENVEVAKKGKAVMY